MKNLNLLFNKSYFNGIEKSNEDDPEGKAFKEHLKDCNQQICGVLFRKADYMELEAGISPMEQRFRMKTSYPGLLVGTGYAHEAEKGSNECIKLGFSFDYVTGQPYVPGSSVKGMLKSCFQPDVIGEVLREIQVNAREYQIEQKDLLAQNQIDTLVNKLEALKAEIFDGRDIFFDAVLYSGGRINSDSLGDKKKGNVMALDYITPHGEATKNPTPLMMVKVLPNVIFEFRFRLSDSIVEGITVSKQQKIALFRTLIELFGVGAKTNVGYGVLTFITKEAADQQRDLAEADAQRAMQARTASAPAPSRPAQPQRQALPQPRIQYQRPEQTQPQSNQPQQPPPGKHLCPACQKDYADNWRILCTPCFREACGSEKCAIPGCENHKNFSPSGSGYQPLCGMHHKEYIKRWPPKVPASSP